MSYSFTEINVPIIDSNFQDAYRKVAREDAFVTYKVFAKSSDGIRIQAARVCGPDLKGILYIGRGSINRLNHLATSLGKYPTDHHFGLKYCQLPIVLERISPVENLYLEICTFPDDASARNCEREEQMNYRALYGENPPYSGRWEGL